MKFSKSRSPMTTSTTSNEALGRSALLGGVWGAGAGVFLCVAAWLSPLAASDRPALALLAVTVSLPLGCLIARRAVGPREASAVGLRGIVAALSLAGVVSLADPVLFLRTASWCLAAVLIGLAFTSVSRGFGVLTVAGWLLLCALPFVYDRLPLMEETAEAWAMQACPWLGFAQDAIGGDPLRRPVLYLGHWTELSNQTSISLMNAAALWLTAVPGFAAMIVASGVPPEAKESETAGD